MITKAELETTRSAAEILAWVLATHDRFRATKELRAAARQGKFFAKELIEEALPIAYFAHRYFDASPDVRITHVVGNQPYDALVDDRRPNPSSISHIETTVSDWSYEESLRMEILNRDGHVPAYGKVRAEGAKGRRNVLESRSAAQNHDEIREQHIAGVIAAVKRKTEIEYPEGTAFVVRVDDAVPFREDEDVEALDCVAQSLLVPMVSGREFQVLALEGCLSLHLVYEL